MLGRSISICAVIKDEGKYLLEWIAYHRALGIARFSIYDNESTDEGRELLAVLSRIGLVEVVQWPTLEGKSPQMTAFHDYIDKNRGSEEFVAFIDPDEFLAISGDFHNLPDLFGELDLWRNHVSAIAVNQRVFGSSGHLDHNPGYVIERFAKCAGDDYSENHWFKTICRPSRISYAETSHFFRLKSGFYVDCDGKTLDLTSLSHGTTPRVGKGLRLNHYIVKSLAEFRVKQSRGGSSGATKNDRMKRYSDDFFFGRDVKINVADWSYGPKVMQGFRQSIEQLKRLF